jgi:LPXTG-motif cell wall-anchored protein
VAGLAVGGFLLGPLTAVAHAEAAPAPELASATTSAGSGEDVSGGGCLAHVSVQLQFDGVTVLTTQSTSTGHYSVHFIVPVSAVPGTHRVTVVCAGAQGQVTNSATVAVELPHTGIDAQRPTLIALLLLLLGIPALLMRRRRQIA